MDGEMNAVVKPDNVPEVLSENVPAPKITPERVKQLGRIIQQIPGHWDIEACKVLTSHFFCDGIYMREFFLPSGMLAVGLVHRYESFFMIVVGEATITTADGSVRRVKAPFIAVTQPGGQRVVAAHEDTVFLTFHANPSNSRDIDEIEARLQIREETDMVVEKLT